MSRLALIFLLGASLPFSNSAQENSDPWLSLSRLSLRASASFHYAPWKKHNESMKLAQDAIRFDPSFDDPQGNLQKINGDGTVDVSASYRVIAGLFVDLTYGSLSGGGTFDASYYTPGNTLSRRYYGQSMRLHVREVGGGFRYSKELSDAFDISAFATFVRLAGSLRFEYQNSFFVDALLFSANLDETRNGATCGVEIQFKTIDHINIVSSIDYRWMKFPDLRGQGTYLHRTGIGTSAYEYSQPFNAQLGEADGYFGLMIPSQFDGYIPIHTLHELWRLTPAQSYWLTQQPATLDLSGFGISLGVQYEF